MQDPERLTAAQARDALDAGEVTSEALVTACLERVRKREDAVAAWAQIDVEKSLEAARRSDQARARGAVRGTLDGIPVGVKDIIDTADFATENGTPVFRGRRPQRDAFVVAQLKAKGAIILGKTVTTELAFFGPGKTRNPHDPARTPGGSSSGSAAAVADFQVPLALGTQTAGSIIRPASYCGAIGFKPTFGAVSRTGILPQSAPLDTVGGYARSVGDIALLMHAISRYDIDDGSMTSGMPAEWQTFHTGVDEGRPPRIAFVKTAQWPMADAAARDALETFADSFGSAAEIVEVALPSEFDGALRLQQVVQFHDIARNYGPIVDAHPDVVSGKLHDVVAEGRTFSKADYHAALAERDHLYQLLRPVLVHYDAIITPAATGVAPLGLGSTGLPTFNAVWTFLGMPCLSLPLIDVDGLPLGVQLVAARDDDVRLLRVGAWFEARGRGEAK